jgi:predicted aspartyl protease
LGERKSGRGFGFTITWNGIVHSLHTPVNVESAINPGTLLGVIALWDTGAGSTLIRPEVAAKLNLKPIAKTLINTPSDKDVPSNVYLIHIHLPNGVKVVNIRACEGTPNNCDMLIGMDVISFGDFAITNFNGHTMFSFRIPSMTEIDFKNIHTLNREKYKFCCGKR